MMKHTPGPWGLEDRGYKFIVSKDGDGYITRDVCRMDGSTMSAFSQEANARLIAAAPDLLETLQACLAMLERADCSTGYCCCGSPVEGHGIGDGHGPVDEGDHHQLNAMDAARAAIAKATE